MKFLVVKSHVDYTRKESGWFSWLSVGLGFNSDHEIGVVGSSPVLGSGSAGRLLEILPLPVPPLTGMHALPRSLR